MEDGKVRTPVTRRQLAAVALGGLVAGAILGFGGSALLDALATWRAVPSAGFDFWPALCNILLPWTTREWLGLLGPVSITLILGAAAPALVAARRGIARSG